MLPRSSVGSQPLTRSRVPQKDRRVRRRRAAGGRDTNAYQFDKNTGDQRWRTDRDELSSWGTPLVIEHDGRVQVVTTGTTHVTSYDLETGNVVWHGPGLTLNPIPSAIEHDGNRVRDQRF